VSRWRVTVRIGPRVERVRAETLDEALDELEARTRAAATAQGRRGTIDLRIRRFEPEDQVIIRSELRGPGRWRPTVRAGLDVRGDGEIEAWTGSVRRERVTPEEGETPYDAVRRATTAAAARVEGS
jgi:hypothetical protein